MAIVTDDQVYRLNVLLEEIRSQVGVIADGHKVLNGKIDGVAAQVAVLTADVGLLKVGQATANERLSQLEAGMVSVNKRLGKIEHHVGLNGVPTRPKRGPKGKK